MRKIIVSGKQFEYRIGKQWAVIQATPSKLVIPLSEIKGIPSDTIERGRYKKTSDGMITPKDIKKYILDNFSF